ncbi:MAG: MASE1 domain-containing protein [Candidatus Competibacteraceae bacterium]
MAPKSLIANLIVATGYAFAGQIGLLLAIPPSNAAAVWPAAGIAIATMVIFGPRILPGILFGGILTRTNFYVDATSLEFVISSLVVDVSISLGATIQAWLAYQLVRHLVKDDPGLVKERSVLYFLLLAGPLASVVSATLGNVVLWLKGLISPSDFLLSWCTWWIGDSIGVLVFAPVVLCLFAQPADVWRTRVRFVALPLSVLTIGAVAAFVLANRQEMGQLQSRFENNADVLTEALNRSISVHRETVLVLKELFDSSKEVALEEFQNYVIPKLNRHKDIQALEWIARVTREERDVFEQARRTGHHGKSIRRYIATLASARCLLSDSICLAL